jgi:hypothetical protein
MQARSLIRDRAYTLSVIVRCVKIIDPFGDEVAEYPGVRVGGDYPVLEVSADPEAWYIRILDDDGAPPGSLWDPQMFTTTDDRIPTSWTASMTKPGALRLAPSRWQRPGFWGEVMERNPEALADVERGIADTLAETQSGPSIAGGLS